MAENRAVSYAIKYEVKKVSENDYVLTPVGVEGGLSDGVSFSIDEKTSIPILRNKNSLTHRYVVSKINYTDDLEKLYKYKDDPEFLSQFFFAENNNAVLHCKIEDNGELKIYDVNFDKYKKDGPRLATYHYDDNGEPMVTLNADAIEYLLSGNDKEEIKRRLEFYRGELTKFAENQEDGVIRIDTENDKIVSMDEKIPEGGINLPKTEVPKEQFHFHVKKDGDVYVGNPDVSFIGLRDAIRKNVFGHDEEINIIAKRLYRNHIAGPNRKMKSVLITGPTGTGKTETVKSAARYLGVPYTRVNTTDLVPTGYVGPKLDDYLMELYLKSGKNLTIAQKALFFMDEYDKIGTTELKAEVKPSLLSFNEGEKIMISNLTTRILFDTSRLNRVYAGVFERLEERFKKMGFTTDAERERLRKELTGPEIKKAIIQAKYFSPEDLGRIRTFVRYDYLSKDMRRDILRSAGGSDLLDTILGFKQDFGVETEVGDDFIYAFLETVPEEEGIRDMGTYLDQIFDKAEDELLLVPKNTYKKLVLTKKTVDNPKDFELESAA